MRLIKRGEGEKEILIVGAGEAGNLIVHEIQSHPEIGYHVVGFVDDDPAKQNTEMYGIQVLGPIDGILSLVPKLKIEEVLICIPSAPGGRIRDIVNLCQTAKVKYRILPGVFDILSGRARVSTIRDVDIKDLLKRKPVPLELNKVTSYIANQRVLVTGAGGSIGSELCRQVCELGPFLLLLLDHEETNLYEIDHQLRDSHPDLSIVPLMCEITDERKVFKLFERYEPAVIFHAAAYKHVPLLEGHPEEAVKVNIMGTKVAASAACSCGAKKFVFISTDKSLNPTSVMGVSKRIAEMVVQSMWKNDNTDFIIVRFGNVLGSRGSAVPLFRKQIAKGGPITVTDSRMIRYFMTTEEAVQLVIQSAAFGENCQIFFLDMGQQVRILNLAEDMIRLSGFEPYVDIDIKFIGKRPGEKLYEEIVTQKEGMEPTPNKYIFKQKAEDITAEKLEEDLWELEKLAIEMDREGMITKFKQMVPSYTNEE